MKTPKLKLKLAGSSKPPADLDGAARKTLGSRYERFVAEHPNFTTSDLVKFAEAN